MLPMWQLEMNHGWGIVVYGTNLDLLAVDLLKDIGISRFSPGREILLAVILMLAACATQQPTDLKPPPLLHAGPRVQVADVDILAVSPAMDEFIERYILEYSNKRTRLDLLMNAVSPNGVLGFGYDETLTRTSAEAFAGRAGNCLGFSNMMIALARRAGLQAEYQEVFRRPEWASREDTVLLIKHINIILSGGGNSYVVDVSGIRITPNTRQRVIDDNYAKALYLNNIGAESLLENDLPTAYAYMSKAIETEPLLTDSWVNMGVLFGRTEQLDEAALVLQQALEIDTNEYSALSNLYEVYIAQEDMESAAKLYDKVEKYRQNNPYYLLQLSEEALQQNRIEDSVRLLARAIRKKQNDHLLYFAMAKTQYLSGETESAEDSLLRARELAPEHMLAQYNRPLDELVAEDLLNRTSE